MATIYVDNQATLTEALATGGRNDIILTRSFELTQTNVVDAEYVSLSSDLNGPYTLTRETNDVLFLVQEGSQLDINNVTIDGTSADGSHRMIDVYGTLRLYNEEALLQNNTLASGLDAADSDGGAVKVYGLMAMYGGTIYNNVAQTNGGGISVADGGSLQLYNTLISENQAGPTGLGGGVYVDDGGYMYVGNDIYIMSNRAYDGGGVYAQPGSDIRISGGNFEYNQATRNGGGLYLADAMFVQLTNISENTAGQSGGGLYALDSLPITQSSINYNVATNGGGLFIPAVSATNSSFEGNRATNNGGAVYLAQTGGSSEFRGTTLFSGNIAENYDGGAIFVPIVYLDDLNIGSDVIFERNEARYRTHIHQRDIATHEAHVLTNTFSYGMPYAYNNYDIAYPSAAYQPSVGKTAIGKELVGNEFVFGVIMNVGTASYLISTAANNASGQVVFPEILYGGTGAYQYTYRELTTSGDGWTVSTGTPTMSINVAIDGENYLVATADPVTGPSFINVYSPEDAEAVFTAHKYAIGQALVGSDFTFTVYNQQDIPVATATNDISGSITFPAVAFGQTGTYYYEIGESSPSFGPWTTDSARYPAVIQVTDDGSGQLAADVSYPYGTPVFFNRYEQPHTNATIIAQKMATGKALVGGDFQFGLFSGASLVAMTSNNAGGAVQVGMGYNEPGVYQYTLRETTTSGNGWTTDASQYPVTVTVSTDVKGNLQAMVSYPSGIPSFINRYSSSPISVDLSATKFAIGKELPRKEFTFGLYDNSGTLQTTATNLDGGAISFAPLTFNAPGVYYYYMREISESGNGWTTDSRQIPVVITVTDNGMGSLVASVDHPFGVAAFSNTYATSPAVVTPVATKTASGAALPAERFTFGLYNFDTEALVDTATNTGDGRVTFGDLTFESPGVYTYQVREITPPGGGWTHDATVYTATVTVSDDGAGQLVSNIEFSPSEPSFHNTYDPEDTSEDIYGYKVLNNWSGEEVAFDFALTTPDGTPVATTQNSDGVIHFTTDMLSEPGTYHYIMKETSQGGNGWTTDPAEFPVTVTVTDVGLGVLHTAVEYPGGTPTFVNHYAATPASLDLTGTKLAVGKELTGNDFIFGVYDEEGNIRATAYNDAEGNIVFPAITFDRAGLYTYTVRELSTDQDGWITDKNEYPVTIEVVDNGDGTFSISTLRYVRGTPTFTNVYGVAPVTANLYAAKNATGKALVGNDFAFAVQNAQGTVVATAANNAQGSVSFPLLSFSEPGVYRFTLLETTPAGDGWKTDANQVPVVVTVTDNGQGALNAAVSYPEGVPIFNNEYSENTVHFEANGGTHTADQLVLYGNRLQRPDDPARLGYSFCGWFADPELTIPYDFNQPVIGPLTLYACWNPIEYEVFFDSNGGSEVPPQYVQYGGAAQRPADPYRVGYTFCGWFADPALTIPYDFSQPVTEPMTLYACWTWVAHPIAIARKALVGAQLSARQFTFALYDSAGREVATATNDSQGNIAFSSRIFAEGTHVYTLREVGTRPTPFYQYDTRPRQITITASPNGEITASPMPTFVNRFVGWNSKPCVPCRCIRRCRR
ncbi:MAG: InlB B-repeat-containing protein [Oscillospiraceae bacterium]|nr:InlB B-repeat-containing protein [Oscillospiraceae bacterium]